MGLEAADLGPEPWAPFTAWQRDAALSSGQRNPNAMTLCTVGPDGTPQGRVVLLKGWDERGLRFYTNRESEKGRALAGRARAEAVFHWDALGRQLRVRGGVDPQDREETAAYFHSRPRASRLAAWASEQSRPVSGREEMERRLAEAEARFSGRDVDVPPAWCGYRLKPDRFEFWQEGAARFHDRIVYTAADGAWTAGRLFP